MSEELQFKNINKPVLEIPHSELESVPNSIFKKICPVCKTGFLLVYRSPKTLILEEYDRCLLCGQRIRYIDINLLREKDGPSSL